MRHSKTFIFSIRASILAFAIAGLSACGSGGSSVGGGMNDPNSNGAVGGPGSVELSLQLQGVANSTRALAIKAHETSDDAGTLIDLTDVRVGVRDVEFFLPPGVRCEDVQFTFVSPVRCDADDDDVIDDDDNSPDDDGTPDQGSGDMIKASQGSGDDDGTPDQGPGDNPADDDQDNDDDNGIDDDQEAKVVVEGPFVADLIAGTTTPDVSAFLIPAGLYTRIDIRVDDNAALGGSSLLAAGTFDYQGTTHDLRVALRFNEDIRFRNQAGIEVTEDGANEVIVTLDETTWFRGINLTRCLDEGELEFEADGSLVIDESLSGGACDGIENRIRDNIEASGSFVGGPHHDDNPGVPDDEDDDDGTPDQGPGDH